MTDSAEPRPPRAGARRSQAIATALATATVVSSFVIAGPGLTGSGVYRALAAVWPPSAESRERISQVRLRRQSESPLARAVRTFAVGWQRVAPLGCAVWAALGPGAPLVRFFASIACLATLACWQSHRAPDDALGLYLGVFLVFVVPLVGARALLGLRLAWVHRDAAAPRRGLSVSDLLWITSLAALVVVGVRFAVPFDDRTPIDVLSRLWGHLSSRLVYRHDAIMLLPPLVLGGLILCRQRRAGWAVASVIVQLTLVAAALPFLHRFGPVFNTRFALDWYARAWTNNVSFTLGVAAGAAFAAWVFRYAGFRLDFGQRRPATIE